MHIFGLTQQSTLKQFVSKRTVCGQGRSHVHVLGLCKKRACACSTAIGRQGCFVVYVQFESSNRRSQA